MIPNMLLIMRDFGCFGKEGRAFSVFFFLRMRDGVCVSMCVTSYSGRSLAGDMYIPPLKIDTAKAMYVRSKAMYVRSRNCTLEHT